MKDRIKLLRKTLKLNQTDFASSLGMTMRAIQKWEAGEVEIKISSLKLLEKVFNANIDWLINGTGSMFLDEKEKKADSGVVRAASSYNVPERLLILLSKLKKEDLIRVEGYIQAIVDSYKNKDMQKLSS